MTKTERRAINIANAQKSTGPRTEAGKNISKYNAVRHGLCSLRAVHSRDATEQEIFNQIESAYQDEYRPQTLAEVECVITMVEMQWQLLRVRRLIEFTFDRGLDILIVSKAIDNFSRHQGRVHKMYDESQTRLNELQQARRKAEKETPNFAARHKEANHLGKIGFVLHIPRPNDADYDPEQGQPDEESVYPKQICAENSPTSEVPKQKVN